MFHGAKAMHAFSNARMARAASRSTCFDGVFCLIPDGFWDGMDMIVGIPCNYGPVKLVERPMDWRGGQRCSGWTACQYEY
jgi:hypothetical protein